METQKVLENTESYSAEPVFSSDVLQSSTWGRTRDRTRQKTFESLIKSHCRSHLGENDVNLTPRDFVMNNTAAGETWGRFDKRQKRKR